jgi:probable HAF family extracellular repeat protein
MMQRRIFNRIGVVAMAAAVVVSWGLVATAAFLLTDLGTLGGNWSYPTAINDAGQVLGMADVGDTMHGFFWDKTKGMIDLGVCNPVGINASGQVVMDAPPASGAGFQAAIWDNGVITWLGTLGGDGSTAKSINDAGQVVGEALTSDDSSWHAFIWQNGVMGDLGTFPGGSYSDAIAINNSGQVIGTSADKDGNVHAFIWQNGLMKDLGTLGGPNSDVQAINNVGQVVGRSDYPDGTQHGFIWSQATGMVDLGTLPDGTTYLPMAINDVGQVLCSYYPEYPIVRSLVWQNGVVTDLGLLPGRTSLESRGINNAGQVVGTADLPVYDDTEEEWSSTQQMAFVWTAAAGLQAIGTLSGDESVGIAINQAGQMIGEASITTPDNGLWHGFIAPVSAPKADAGPDFNIGATPLDAQVTLDGSRSYDADGDPLTYKWREGGTWGTILAGPSTNPKAQVLLCVGRHIIELIVSDPAGNTDTDTVVVTVTDPTGRLSISGRVTEGDYIGTPFPSVVITAVRHQDSLIVTSVSGTNGFYSLNALPAGTYTVTAHKLYASFEPGGSEPARVVTVPPTQYGVDFRCVARVSGQPTIKVELPNGGEVWDVGSPQTICWTSDETNSNVTIELSRDGGITFETVYANIVDIGQGAWVVTGPATQHARIRARATNGSAQDLSDADFVIRDNVPPTLTAPPDITAEAISKAGTPVALGAPQVSDNADLNPIVTNNAPALFPLGQTLVVWTATDASGNSATAVQKVTIVDTTPPALTAPPDVTVEATSPTGTPVVLGTPTVNDNADPAPVVSNNAPALFQLGTTSVTWKANDKAGNSATVVQKVTVVDTTPPVLTAPANVTVEATSPAGTPVALGTPTVKDNADPNPPVTNNAPATFPLGTTSVTWKATDKSGNSSTVVQTVTVVDTTPPMLTAPANVTVEATSPTGTPVTLGTPTVKDNADPNPSLSNNAPAVFLLGTTSVTWKATDKSGNSSTVVQKVTVVDTTTPALTAPRDVTAEATKPTGTPVALGTPTVSDNADPHPVVTNNAPAVFPVGVTLVTWIATDASGNVARATQKVTITDRTAPVINSVTADPNSIWPPNKSMVPVTVTVAATDNGNAVPVSKIVSVTCNETIGTSDVKITGALTVSLIADRNGNGNGRVYTIKVACTDASGNTSTATVNVTVPHDQGKNK